MFSQVNWGCEQCISKCKAVSNISKSVKGIYPVYVCSLIFWEKLRHFIGENHQRRPIMLYRRKFSFKPMSAIVYTLKLFLVVPGSLGVFTCRTQGAYPVVYWSPRRKTGLLSRYKWVHVHVHRLECSDEKLFLIERAGEGQGRSHNFMWVFHTFFNSRQWRFCWETPNPSKTFVVKLSLTISS